MSKNKEKTMKIRNYFLATVLCWVMALTGCSMTGKLPISIQVVGDNELASIDQVALSTITEIIKAKYPDRIDRIVRYCDIALASPDDQFEAYFNNGLKMLPDLFINDPVIRGAVKGFMGSFKINVDTESVIFDIGALRRARQIITALRDQLAG